MSKVEQALPGALIGVGADLQLELLETGDPAKVYEADLRRFVSRHLRRRLPNEWRVEAETSIGREVVHGAGNTDIAVTFGETRESAIELKWWSDPPNQTDNSLWDAVKLATLVRDGLVGAGYLITGAREATWAGKNPLARFWTGGEWPLGEILEWKPFYGTVFSDTKGPSKLPWGLRTAPVGDPVTINTLDEQWSVRCCRVWELTAS